MGDRPAIFELDNHFQKGHHHSVDVHKDILTLREMHPGDKGVVTKWVNGGAPLRLLEMGLLEGTEFEVIRLAPFGDPIEIRIRGYHVSLRKSEASRIQVERQGGRVVRSPGRGGANQGSAR
jgi:ferrous iron transport protein A